MVLHDALVAEKNLIITRNFGMKLSQNKSSWLGAPKTLGSVIANDPNKTNIDIWIVDDWGFDGMHDDMPHCDHRCYTSNELYRFPSFFSFFFFSLADAYAAFAARASAS